MTDRNHREGRRILVCGGRDFNEADKIAATLDALHTEHQIAFVIHGNARGADYWAGAWAKKRYPLVGEIAVPAEWSKFGKGAGPKRNQKMLGHGPSLVVAFSGGTGTADMVKRARLAGIVVMEVA
jgi:hypothetical protein